MTDPVPADVVIARSLRAHTRTLLAMCATCVVLALVGAGAVGMAGEGVGDPRVVAGLTMLGAGQLLAIAAAVVALAGLLAVMRGVGEPGSAGSASAVRRDVPRLAVTTTARRFALLLRLVVAVVVLGITAWVLVEPAGVLGAVVGAVLVAQVAVVVAIVRVRVLLPAL